MKFIVTSDNNLYTLQAERMLDAGIPRSYVRDMVAKWASAFVGAAREARNGGRLALASEHEDEAADAYLALARLAAERATKDARDVGARKR